MLDAFGILVSTIMIVIVVVNAVRLDKTEPWFQTRKDDAATAGKPWVWERRR